jgi:Fur family transcriptional regulator, ferric uptake regulator
LKSDFDKPMVDPELVFFPTWTAGRQGYAQRVRELFEEELQKKGLRLTKQRERILETLLGAERHLSQEEMYQALKGKGIGRVTVFRMLKLLEDCGLVDRVNTRDGHPRYELKGERPHHDHLICLDCGAITEVRWPQVEKIQDKACKELGFEIVYHRHEVFGRCRLCTKKTP